MSGLNSTLEINIRHLFSFTAVPPGVSLHPPNLIDSTTGSLLPNALVPFCFYQSSIQGDVIVDEVGQSEDLVANFTACNSFQPTVIDGQLCFSLSASKSSRMLSKEGKDNGLLLVIDTGLKEIKSPEASSFKIYMNTLARFSDTRSGIYALSALKKMKGTDSYLKLPDEEKDCQIESFEECAAKEYLAKVEKMCGCVPWALTQALDLEVRETQLGK